MSAEPSSAPRADPGRVLLVTGMSGAGKSSALKALEDLGYEAIDNMPLRLLRRLLVIKDAGAAARPLAIGIDTRTRAFDADTVVRGLRTLRESGGLDVRVVFMDCSGAELVRRFSETRRRHPLALDRPATDGIASERELLAPLRRVADIVIDTTDLSVNDFRRDVMRKFARAQADQLTLTILSFGFARGLPRDADLVFDMRFLANPHWVPDLRPLTGRDAAVGDYVAADPGFDEAFGKIADLLLTLLPRYRQEGKAYLTAAFGCTGGRHRSVYVSERMAETLRSAGWEANLVHRDAGGEANDGDEDMPPMTTEADRG
jgi:UPF0042 nucleotide-binding protein